MARIYLLVDGPTRRRTRVLHSVDLVNWETGFDYVYIGSEPSVFAPGYFGDHCYRSYWRNRRALAGRLRIGKLKQAYAAFGGHSE